LKQFAPHRANALYPLATGVAAEYRQRLLHAIYGAGTRRALPEAGLRPGMGVADVGCGVGMVAALLAELAGPEAYVLGINASADQCAQAHQPVHPQRSNATFLEASAIDTGL
jgi:ubiquinone/menaquinone biosynthesis C-methylase UbiE